MSKQTNERRKKRVGIITIHCSHNYGSRLQAYASNRLLNQLGYDCELIDFIPQRLDNRRMYKLYQDAPEYTELKKRYADEIQGRKEKFADFMNLYRLSVGHYASDDEINANPPEYDAYVTGGDQVWNVNFRIASDAYFLAFTDSPEKYAFSTSVGRCKEDKLSAYKQYLVQYKRIYVREQAGADRLNHLLDGICEASTMIDPTLTLPKENWMEVVSTKSFYDGDYIGCYATLDDDLDAMMPILKELHDRRHQKVVLWGMALPREEDWIVNVIDAGPREFLKLVSGAQLLITSSFHGTAFAVNLGVPFLVYADQLEDTRKAGLLTMLDHSHRLVHSVEELDNVLNSGVNFAHISEVLITERERAVGIIKECLGDVYV